MTMVGGGFLRTDGGLPPDRAEHVPQLAAHERVVGHLWLALRQCATHAAGPLTAVAELVEETRAGEVDPRVVEDALRVRLEHMDMPDDRRQRADAFLDALFSDVLR